MSNSAVLTSLKLAMIAKIKAKPKLKEDTVANFGLDIFHMQTLPALSRFISSNKLGIDITNLQEDFDAEQCAAATPSFLPSMGPTAIASHRRLDKKAVDDLRVMSWETPASKTEMKSFIPVQIKDETSTSLVLTSLKLAMIAKIKEKAKLKEDAVSNLGRDIYHMQTLSDAMLFISINDLAIDTTNLKEDFDAERRGDALLFTFYGPG